MVEGALEIVEVEPDVPERMGTPEIIEVSDDEDPLASVPVEVEISESDDTLDLPVWKFFPGVKPRRRFWLKKRLKYGKPDWI